MIDKLLCFDNGFIKFEDNFSRICAAYKPLEAYLVLFDGKLFCYEFSHHVSISSPINKLPSACGIFNKLGKPVFLFGNSGALKEEFYRTHPLAEEKNIPTIKESEEPVLKEPILKEPTVEEAIQEEPKTEELLELDDCLNEESLNNDEIVDLLSKNDEPQTFWQCNSRAFLEKLASGTEEKELSSLIPGSRWSKPNDEDYVMGVIFDENDEPMYLCYGFENVWSENPPKDFDGYSQWIPKNFAEPHEEGYWVIYINAVTGERVK